MVSYKRFDDEEEDKGLSTQNLLNLAMCDARIVGAQASVATPALVDNVAGGFWKGNVVLQEQADGEIARLKLARKDIMKRLTADEKSEYKAHVAASKPKSLSKEEQAAAMKEMDKNKDRPSH